MPPGASPLPSKLRHAPAYLGAELDVAHVLHVDGGALGRRADGDVLDVPHALDISPPPYHVFEAGEVEHAPFHVEVAPPYGLHHLGYGNVVAEEAVRVDGDLVLLDEAADARNLRDARNAFERELQVPVLEGAQLRKVEVVLLIDDRVFEAPAEARRVGAEDGVDIRGELVRARPEGIRGRGCVPSRCPSPHRKSRK